MTDDNNIRQILSRLEKLMYGYNYEVTIDLDIFENCSTLEVFQKQLADKYNKVKPSDFQPTLFDKPDFWEEVNFGLTFRGDKHAGLILTSTKEEELLREQETLTTFISQFISDKTKIYRYPDDLGVGGYIVFWGFTFLLLNNDKPTLLFYGSASD